MKKQNIFPFFVYVFLLLFLFPVQTEAKETLAERKKMAVDEIYQCLLAFEDYADISEYQIPYSEKTATALFDRALDKNLYLFNILANVSDFTNNDGFCSCYTQGSYLVGFEFNYKGYSASTLNRQYKKLYSEVARIKKELNLSSLTPEWAVLEVHDYIALHTDYDPSKKPKRRSFTAYGALISGKAVCSGYSTACELLLSSVGIKSKIVTSNVMDHAWNIVKLGNKWYHLDITWDDPYINKKNYVSYQFFLKTDKEFKSNQKTPHYGWKTNIKCTSTKYQNIPLTDNTTLSHLEDGWYVPAKTKKGIYYYKKYNFSFTRREKAILSVNLIDLTLKKNLSMD